MAVLKHIKSRNANYSDALEYLLFQHDEKSGKVLYDDLGRKLLREDYMTQSGDHKAGRKHRLTNKFLEHFKKEVMEMCEREGLHQIDLLSPAPEKVTETEFRTRARGQKKME